MTDQPETELEYLFRKLSRKMVTAALLTVAAIMLTGSAVIAESNPTMSMALALGAGAQLVVAHANSSDGRVRWALNKLLPGDDVEELQRPGDTAEVPADD